MRLLAILVPAIAASLSAQIVRRDPTPQMAAAITSPNIGQQGTLDILEGGPAPRAWSFDIATGAWQALDNVPERVGSGAAISQLFNGCDFAFAGDGQATFFATGTTCRSPKQLADTPAPVGAGAALAAAMGTIALVLSHLNPSQAAGIEKAAILMVMLGDQVSAEMLKEW